MHADTDGLEKIRYPIGRFNGSDKLENSERKEIIRIIKDLPDSLNDVISELTEAQLDTEYREGGWTIRELVHHIADSHMNAFVRFKLALTEDNPTIKPYKQDEWVKMPDTKMKPEVSLQIIKGIHARWVCFLESMTEIQFSRTLYHPEMEKDITLDYMLDLYGWHSDHHLAHIRNKVAQMPKRG